MKISIITFHFVNNFGGALQAYALQKTIADQCDAEVEIIDYQNPFICFTDTVRLLPITTNPKEVCSGLQTMSQRLGRSRKFKKFTYQNFHLSQRYSTARALKKNPPQADKYVCGSDQIWNPSITLGLATPYFLDFVEEPKKKIAYAPSFGSSMVKKRYLPQISKLLSSIDALSVREQSGAQIIQSLGRGPVECLIDPTLLLTRHEWEKISSSPITEQPYMLLYMMQRDEKIYEQARKQKEQTGLRLVEISRYGFKHDFVDEIAINIGPAEFLSLFKNADYICTNSYHGFVFSLIFEKKFCIVPCQRFQARLYNLADLLEIQLPESEAELDALETHYDPQRVMEILKREKEKAIAYLKKHLLEK